MKTFPELIRYWREHAGLSLSQAAAKAGMTKAHLWELEDGRARNPTIKTLAGLATAYNADLPYLAELAAAALSSEVQPVGSERSDEGKEAEAERASDAAWELIGAYDDANAAMDDLQPLTSEWGDAKLRVRATRKALHDHLVADPLDTSRHVDGAGWLIESWDSKSGEFKASWWALGLDVEDGCGWTTDSTKALRFARARDAQAYIDAIGWTEAKPTEHGWE